MENKKAKDFIIIILIILLLVCLGVVVWQYLKSNNTTSNQEEEMGGNNNTPTQQENVVNKQPEENKEPETNKTESEENKFDPYANYKDFTWGSTKYTSPKSSGTDKTGIEIKDNKVYVTYNNKTNQVKNINGTPKKVTGTINGGILIYYILTEEGNVYTVGWADTPPTAELSKNISKYNVIDFTPGNGKNYVDRVMYYLTAEGKLIDANGDTFEELNKNFVYRFGSLGHKVYVGSDDYIYYSNNGDANYIIIKDTNGNKVKAKELYIQDNHGSEVIIILTQDNQVIYVSDEGKITQEKGKFKSINVYSEDSNSMMLVTMDTETHIIKCNLRSHYYNVVKAEALEMKQETAIESIQMYKRKEGTSEYYQKSMNLTNEQIGRVKEVLSEMKQEREVSSLNNETYKVVIKFKSGIEIVLKVYPASGVVMDDVLYSLEGQTIETFETISYKYSWE